jgi:thioredoxin-related protein
MKYSRMITLSLLLVLPTVVCGQEVQWHPDLNTARKAAKDMNRPILIDFGTANCHWCRQLDATTLRDPTVAKLVADKFVAVKIDAGKDPAFAQSMGVHAFPTLIFLAPDGKILGRHEGYVDAARFQSQLLKAIAQCGATNAPDKGQPVQAVHVPLPAQQTKIRMQAPDAPPMPPPMPRFVLPSPEELGIAVNLSQAALPREGTADYGVLFARLRQIGAVGFHLERAGAGYRASIDFPGPAIRTTTVVGLGASEASAIAMALAHVDARK